MPNSIKDTIQLKDGNQMPIEGFGTYKLADQDSMDAAIKSAYEPDIDYSILHNSIIMKNY
ncbi:hypothetical protein AKUH4B205J_01610 [Apilactobacillus kunkeei]|nr:hypothetical protein AKUH4B205J_01610 [Apilactobacillus kunkeei]